MTRLFILLHQKLLVMPYAALAIFAASEGALITAYIAETFFGILPCKLCIYQRIGYVAVTILSVLAFAWRKNDKRARLVLGLCALVFFVNSGVAVFHSGIERDWWEGGIGCAVNPLVLQDPAAARQALLETPAVRCDQVGFTFLGLTIANWNVPASLALGLFSLLASFGPCVTWAKKKN